MSVVDMTLWQLVLKGGPMMVPILVASFVVMVIVIERWMFLSPLSKAIEGLAEKVLSAVSRQDIKGAVVSCDESSAPISTILRAGLMQAGAPREMLMQVMEQAAKAEIVRLEMRLSALSAIAAIAPVLGILGTVVGMCVSFYTIEIRAAAMNPLSAADAAGGLWQALITTAAGLLLTIFAALAHNYLVARVALVVTQMEESSLALVDVLSEVLPTSLPQEEE